MEKLQDTIEVADVTEHVNRLAEKIKGKDTRPLSGGSAGGAISPLASLFGGGGGDCEGATSASWNEHGTKGAESGGRRGNWSPFPEQEEGAAADSSAAKVPLVGPASGGEQQWAGFAVPPGADSSGTKAATAGVPVGSALERVASVASVMSLGPELSYGALAVAADTLDDKLAVVEHKRR